MRILLLPPRIGTRPDVKSLTALAGQRRESINLEADLNGELEAKSHMTIRPIE